MGPGDSAAVIYPAVLQDDLRDQEKANKILTKDISSSFMDCPFQNQRSKLSEVPGLALDEQCVKKNLGGNVFDLKLTFYNSDLDLMPAKSHYMPTLLHLQHFIGSVWRMTSVTGSYWQLLLVKDKSYKVINKI